MNYKKIHDSIIEKYKLLNLKKGQGQYLETHHIIPKCLGGLDIKENRVNLPAREHFLIHRLLTRIYPDNRNLKFAFYRCSQINTVDRQFIPSSRDYAEAKELRFDALSSSQKERYKSENIWNKGQKSGFHKKCEDEDCQNTFYVTESNKKRKYCSKKCYSKNYKEKDKTIRKNISESAKNNKDICRCCGYESNVSTINRFHNENCKLQKVA